MCDGSDPFHIVSLNAQKPRGDVGKRCGGNDHGGCEPERSPDDLVRQGTRTGRTPGASPTWLPVDGVEAIPQKAQRGGDEDRSEEHTSEIQSLMRLSYAVFCLKKKNTMKK